MKGICAMQIEGSIALVTGGNRGLGKAFVQALLDAGARKVYVGARKLIETDDPRLQPIKLDVTSSWLLLCFQGRCVVYHE